MNTHTLNQTPWTRLMAWGAMVLFALMTAACGGSGAGAGGGSGTSSGVTNASQMTLISSETSLGSDGKKSATITAIVKDESNRALNNQAVLFSSADPGVTLVGAGTGQTDESGSTSVSLSVTDRTVRDIIIVAETGSLIESISIPVVGTVLQINGSSTIVFNAATQYSVSLRDSGGNPITGADVSVASSNGNTVSQNSVTTDTQGQAVFEVTGTQEGSDVLTASAQGVTAAFETSVSGTQLTYSAPTPGFEITVDDTFPVAIQLIENGSPVSGRDIRFTVTRGLFVGSDTATTDGSGAASVNIISSTAGLTTITATEVQGGSSTGVTATRQAEFVSKSPTKLELQTSPSVVGANLSATGTNSSQLIAVVRDDNDNPVKNVRVDFTAIADPSNGRIEPGFGITDSFGTATASFIAGPTTTGFEAVQLQAKLSDNSAVNASASLTVSELELSVRMGTGNELVDTGSLVTYTMPWTTIVADSAGNPVENALITVALRSTQYRKGFWQVVDSSWTAVINETCVSEDGNNNGRLDTGEDTNLNGELDPGAVAVARVVEVNARTDENGLAAIEVTYPKTFGVWVEVEMLATITTVSGTEATAKEVFFLTAASADLANITNTPPGSSGTTGPFGQSFSCADID